MQDRATLGLREKARRALEAPSAAWAIVAITLAISLPSIGIGFFSDDNVLRSFLGGTWPGAVPPVWDLYRFVSGDTAANREAMAVGGIPWWSAPELKLHLVRPLSSLLFWADHSLFGDGATGYHLHAIGWYVALVAAVGLLFRQLLSRATAHLALLIFACSTAHVYAYAWISARHMVVAALPCVLGLIALLRSARLGPWLAALGLALGLAGSEAAASCVGFLLGYAALAPAADARRRFVRILPALGTFFVYLTLYWLAGGGAVHSDAYVDPLHAPREFGGRVLTVLPTLVANAVLGVPADVAPLLDASVTACLGLAALVLVVWLARATARGMASDEREQLPWLTLGAVAALLPVLGGFPGARVLLLPNLGFAVLLAVLIRRGTSAAGAVRVAGSSLAVIHLLLPPLVGWSVTATAANVARQVERIAARAEIGPHRPRVYVIGASDPMVTIYAGSTLLATAPERLACWCVLSGSKQAHHLQRSGTHQLLLQPQDWPLLRDPFERLYRAYRVPMRVGDSAVSCGATFTVVAVEHGLPTEVSVTFDRPLEDASIRLLLWRDGRLVALTPPALGDSTYIRWSPGPLGFF